MNSTTSVSTSTEQSQEPLQDLRRVLEPCGSNRTFSELIHHAQLVAELHAWCEDSLASAHLVEVASFLASELELSLSDMERLGVPADLLTFFPKWELGSQAGFTSPAQRVLPPLLGSSYKLGLLRLQLSPFSPTLSGALLLTRRLLEVLDETVQFSIVIEPGGRPERFLEIISGFAPNAAERVSLIQLQTTSVFAQDNARGARLLSGEPALLIPRAFRTNRDREREALNNQLGSNYGPIPLVRSYLYWEGGNIVNDEQCCFIGIDHVRENMVQLGLTENQVKDFFRAEFGNELEFLGSIEDTVPKATEQSPFASGQASLHIDLDLSPLGNVQPSKKPAALLASPDLGLQFTDDVLAIKRLINDHFMSAEEAKAHIAHEYRSYAEERRERLRMYQHALEARNYKVIQVPDLRINPRINLFSTRNLDFIYSNILTANHKGKPTVFYLPYNIKPIDQIAERAYREAGCEVIKVSRTGKLANLLMLFCGGLRCTCSQVY